MLSLKNMNFCVLNFGDQQTMYLISRPFQKIAKFKSVCVCMCVYIYMCACVCVCVCICGCVYKCGKSKQCCSCYMQNATSHITLRNVTKFEKFINWKFKRFIIYTRRKTLPAWDVATFPRWLKCCIH